MKKLFSILILVLIGTGCYAQNTNALYITSAIGYPMPVYNQRVDGGGSFDARQSFVFGLRYQIKSRHKVSLETGVDFGNYNFTLSYINGNGVQVDGIQGAVKLVTVPVYARLTFWRYFFLNGGLLLDLEAGRKGTSIDKQSGFGLGLGLGFKYSYRKINIFANPFLERHAFLSLADSGGTRQSIINPGVRLGVGYSF